CRIHRRRGTNRCADLQRDIQGCLLGLPARGLRRCVPEGGPDPEGLQLLRPVELRSTTAGGAGRRTSPPVPLMDALTSPAKDCLPVIGNFSACRLALEISPSLRNHECARKKPQPSGGRWAAGAQYNGAVERAVTSHVHRIRIE